MLFGDQQRIAAQHQVPTDRRVSSSVGSAITHLEPPQRSLPPRIGILHIRNGVAFVGDEQVVMIDATPVYQPVSQSELPLQNENGPPTEFDTPVVVGLGAVLVDAVYASLADTQHAVCSVVVGHDQRNFLRRPKARYESCEAESNHIHNIPGLLRDFSADKLAYYLEVELPQFLREIGNNPRGDLLPHWEPLRRWLADFRNR